MQKHWFTCRVKYTKITESGREEKATDSYVLDAHTYTEAEARITHIMMQMVQGVFMIQNIAKANRPWQLVLRPAPTEQRLGL